MKKFTFVLLFFLSCSSNQRKDFKDQSSLLFDQIVWVNAKSGLNLREFPNLKSLRIAKIDYRTMLNVSERDDKIVKIENLNGHWIKVKTNNNLTGWVFEQFVSQSLPPELGNWGLPVFFNQYCVGINNSYRCYQNIERKHSILKKFDKHFKRNKNELTLLLNDNSSKFYKDDSDQVKYILIDYISSINCFVLAVNYFEGSNFLLIDRHYGIEYPLGKYPTVSPQNSKILDASFCSTPGYCITKFQIITKQDHNSILFSEYSPIIKDFGFDDAIWLNENTFFVNEYSENNNDSNTVVFNYFDGNWKSKRYLKN